MTFLVTGHPRGGTLWTAGALRRLGHKVGHEHAIRWFYKPELLLDGEVSWAIPLWKDKYPTNWPVLHLTRNPYRVIASQLQLHVFRILHDRTAEDPGERKERKVDFLCPKLETDDQLRHLVNLYLCWHQQCSSFPEHPYMQVRVEDMERRLSETATFLTGRTPKPHELKWALTLRTNYNSAEERMQVIEPEGPWPAPTPIPDLIKQIHRYPEGPEFFQLVKSLGYKE